MEKKYVSETKLGRCPKETPSTCKARRRPSEDCPFPSLAPKDSNGGSSLTTALFPLHISTGNK